MFNVKHIIVLLDAEEESATAVKKAAKIAAATKSKLTLLSCVYNGTLNNANLSAKSAKHGFLSKVTADLETLAETARLQGLEVVTEVIWEKHSGAGLLNYLSESEADLVVKPTHNQSAVKRTFFSHTDWELIRKCPAPLLLCKRNEWRQPLSISAAVDPVGHLKEDDASDDSIINCAKSLSNSLVGHIELLHVYDPAPLTQYVGEPNVSAIHAGDQLKVQHQKALLDLATKHEFAADNVKLAKGEPSHVIPEFLESNSVDIIAMGAASRKGLKRWLLGNTAERVLDKITIDILVVK